MPTLRIPPLALPFTRPPYATDSDQPPFRAEVFGIDRLEEHAKDWVRSTELLKGSRRGRNLLARLAQNREALFIAQRRFGEAVRAGQPISPAAEWLLDNFYIVQEQLGEIRQDLPQSYYRELPKLANEPYSGYPRVYGLALELIAHSDSRLDAEVMTRFVQAYQSVAPLSIGELWAVAIMLRLGLIENLRRLVDQSLSALTQRAAADAWADRLLKLSSRPATEFVIVMADLAKSLRVDGHLRLDPIFAAHLLQRLRDQDPDVVPAIQWLERRLSEQQTTIDVVVRAENLRRAANRVSVANAITSMRLLSTIDWPAFFESTSQVESVLRADPAGVYANMDFTTRDRYRHVVEQLSKRTGCAEVEVARRAIAHAERAQPAESRAAHVGYHLIDRGLPNLKAELGYRRRLDERVIDWVFSHATLFYLGMLGVISGCLVLMLLLYAANAGASTALLVILALLLSVPMSAVAVSAMNWTITVEVPPKSLPKLEFKDEIPAACRTMVVVPALISRVADIERLVNDLEIRCLANRDEHLHFALLADFADAPQPYMPEDDELLDVARRCVRELNARYGNGKSDRFYFFHRQRTWNEREKAWMGWERKRGNLYEFNRLLRGATDTQFTVQIGDLSILPQINYVITLDADTQLPIDSAKRLIGTIAHPLNRARLDPITRRVVDGYGIIQPRTAVSAPSAAASHFAQVFTGDIGLDPYSTPVSMVYQDLFDTGIFVGKGIYDVDALQGALAGRFPENLLLSHDLIEGAHVRVGMVSDIQLLEDFPSGYDAFAQRQHRWIRGDWQITDWLFRMVYDAAGRRVRNSLPLIERWKIFDNLRRSLLPPVISLLLALGWTVLPGPPLFWTAATLMAIVFPQFISVASSVGKHPRGEPWRGYFFAIGQEAIQNGARALLLITFLLYQALLRLDAIARVIVRRAITHRHLLQWTSAAVAERGQARTVSDYWARMWPAPALALLLFGLVVVVAPAALAVALPFIVLWCASPLVAYFVSQPTLARQVEVSEGTRRELRLIARRTWRFFETFADADNHWLPPDNYQEEPTAMVAHRTSPTNIGFLLLSTLAAYDFGYLGSLELSERLERLFTTLDQLEQYRGHFFNWYDTLTLKPLMPQYVSTVDSGNLAASLLTLKQLCHEIDLPVNARTALRGITDTVAALRASLERMKSRSGSRTSWMAASRPHVAPRRGEKSNISSVSDAMSEQIQKTDVWLSRVEEAAVEGRALTEWLDQLERAAATLNDQARMLTDGPGQTGAKDVQFWCERLAHQLKTYRAEWETLSHAEAITSLRTRYQSLAERAEALAKAMDFQFLYDEQRGLFRIGYNFTSKRFDDNYYDLLASEARLASFVAIALAEVPARHWFRLARPLTRAGNQFALLSWGGSMFEYLMPSLLMHDYEGTLLQQTAQAIVRCQIAYGKRRGVPWGISESGYYAFDFQFNYQYRSFGVPELGLKRELGDNLVVAPYATFLALPLAPYDAWKNIKWLMQEGLSDGYGFYEAIDYTRSRLPPRQRSTLVRSFMAHHQGMSLVSLDNFLNDFPMHRRFHAEPSVAATELILQEQLPRHRSLIEPATNERPSRIERVESRTAATRPFTTAHTPTPRTHILANSAYMVMVTNAGGGYSAYRDMAITRWREDITRDDWGVFCYLKDKNSGEVWSNTYQPMAREADEYEVHYSQDKAQFRRHDGGIETQTEITVSPQDNAEIRRISLTNHSRRPRDLELTSYAEVVLDAPRNDAAHPAFSKLFVESEFVPARQALLFHRRPRSADQASLWAIHVLALENPSDAIEYETDRARFLGRGRTPATAQALHTPLSKTVGAVLDPIMSLRCRVRLAPAQTVRVSLVIGAADSRDGALALASQYRDPRAVERALDLAWTHSQIELQHLNISADEAHLFQRLASRVLYPDPALRAPQEILARNTQGQSGLFGYGISGDYPMVLVRIADTEELGLVRQALLAHEYWRLNNLKVDLVILDQHPTTYAEGLHGQIQALLDASFAHPWIDKPGGVFLRHGDHMPEEDRVLLQTVARVILDGERGSLTDQLERVTHALHPAGQAGGGTRGPGIERRVGTRDRRVASHDRRVASGEKPAASSERRVASGDRRMPSGAIRPSPVTRHPSPVTLNSGFSADGREYVIELNQGQWTPTPWINVIANPQFGCLVSEAGLGYTWSENSQMNRLTPWSNDPISDPPGEAIYLRDEDGGEFWSPTPLPIRADEPYRIRHGMGYTIFEHTSHELGHELLVFVSKDNPIKIARLKLRNNSGRARRMAVTSYAEWVLGTTREQSQHFVVSEWDDDNAILFAHNRYNSDFSQRIAFAAISQKSGGMTADRTEFLGRNGSPARPAALYRPGLSGRVGAAIDPCAAIQTRIELRPTEETELVFLLGQAKDKQQAIALMQQYRDTAHVQSALEVVKAQWDEILGAIQVKTPDSAMDTLLNGWLLYQALACRLWGRTAFYQSSGAYGFRDQLQDVMALVFSAPQIAREHILRAAAHQFVEGDVQHWWHEPGGQGVRTRISDDFLWLPYVTHDYILTTGDTNILDEKVSFLKAAPLQADEHEVYARPSVSSETASLYEHCVRALDHGLRFGAHGLPLVGSGDWNDGMNRVGREGKGESVWLGWFLYTNLVAFADVAERRGDEERTSHYRQQAEQLQRALDENAWDGEWYRRAYFDDGTPLGSAQNDECQIDSIAQSWAVISQAAPPERARAAMQAVEKFLIREADKLILLLTPPFDHFAPDPGYIQGYVPGIRENGGQYTHAALWVVWAYVMQGNGDRAAALFNLLNPINHARTAEEVARYKVEPYVVAGDVYAHPAHIGRGGWTWYTGSAGWMYRVGIEGILGFKLRGDSLSLDPCIPRDWPRYQISYRRRSTRYEITVENPHGANRGVERVMLDGTPQSGPEIALLDDGQVHQVQVILGDPATGSESRAEA